MAFDVHDYFYQPSLVSAEAKHLFQYETLPQYRDIYKMLQNIMWSCSSGQIGRVKIPLTEISSANDSIYRGSRLFLTSNSISYLNG